jgi:class 3 adenylate cyclase
MAHNPVVPATALLVDLRDFTSMYHSFDSEGRNQRFLDFVETFQRICVTACRASFRGDPGERLYLSSTGDGVLAVFEGEPGEPAPHHALRAWLAALRFVERLPALFLELDARPSTADRPRFGIGLESGEVSRVGVPPITTRLGHRINRAARLEPITKTFSGTTIVLGEATNQLLTLGLHDADYAALQRRASDPGQPGEAVQAAWEKMRALNDAVGVFWLGALQLKGVSKPLPAFRTAATRLSRELDAMISQVERRLAP